MGKTEMKRTGEVRKEGGMGKTEMKRAGEVRKEERGRNGKDWDKEE